LVAGSQVRLKGSAQENDQRLLVVRKVGQAGGGGRQLLEPSEHPAARGPRQ
jgi:hypothetical protein